jgi:N4-gp56 family major capsid protein
MADTVNATGLRVQQWDSNFFEEYVRENRFAPYMGTSENAIIQMKEDLTKKKGDRISLALANKLTNDAVTGTGTLEGNEEDLISRSHLLTVDKRRNGVRVAEMSEQKSAIDLRNAGKVMLKNWAVSDTRTLIINALGSFRSTNTIYTYTTGAEIQADIGHTILDAWLVDNADRTLFAGYTGGGTDFSADHGQLDNTDHKMTALALTTAKIKAQTASPNITPIRTKGDEEWFVAFLHPYQIRDLVLSDTTFQSANREARERSKDNPLFRGADYVWDGIIIRSIPEIPLVAASSITGGSAVQTAQGFLCGAQALGYGLAKRWTSKTETFDYGDKVGVAIEQIYGIEKLCFGTGSGDTDDLKQNGVVSIWSAAVT